ncbi:hypothetical protein [Microbispora rosea]|nr:hypothetical protein [Microbispora rosea]
MSTPVVLVAGLHASARTRASSIASCATTPAPSPSTTTCGR